MAKRSNIRGAGSLKRKKPTEGSSRVKVFDLHADTLDRLALHDDFSVPGGFAEHDAYLPCERMQSLQDNDAHVSLARTATYYWCQCFAIFIPDEVPAGDAAWKLFERVERFWRQELERCASSLSAVRTSRDIAAAFSAGKTAGMLSVEGASFLQDDRFAQERLDALSRAGVGMVTLTWNGPNALGSGNDTQEGLRAFGRTMVHELEQRHIALDVSHLNDQGFRDVCAVAQQPFVASHSNARAVCPHPRNLADWQLRELADRKGIAGLNYCRDFLSDTHANPTRDDVLRHVDHILEVAGEDVGALGSDYDGCNPPTWLTPCDKVDTLFDLLSDQFGQAIAQKLFFENAQCFFSGLSAPDAL